MIKHVSESDSGDWLVIDKDTNEQIYGVQWANDETGTYETIVENDRLDNQLPIDCICPECQDRHIITFFRKANIKFVRKSEVKNG